MALLLALSASACAARHRVAKFLDGQDAGAVNPGDCGVLSITGPATFSASTYPILSVTFGNFGTNDVSCEIDVRSEPAEFIVTATGATTNGGAAVDGSSPMPAGNTSTYDVDTATMLPQWSFVAGVSYTFNACSYARSPNNTPGFGVDQDESNRCQMVTITAQ